MANAKGLGPGSLGKSSFMFPGSRGKRGGAWKLDHTQAPPELRKLVLDALLRGKEESPVCEYIHNDHEHWYLSADYLQIPHADRGGREVVFTGLLGPIHKRSVLVNTCGVNDCVNPAHMSIMDRKELEARNAGKWEDRMICPQFRIVKRSEYEKQLIDAQVGQAIAQRRREQRARWKKKGEEEAAAHREAMEAKRRGQARWGRCEFNEPWQLIRDRENKTTLPERFIPSRKPGLR